MLLISARLSGRRFCSFSFHSRVSFVLLGRELVASAHARTLHPSVSSANSQCTACCSRSHV